MKESLLNSISNIIDYIKAFAAKTESEIKFEGNKREIIRVMYNPLIEEKQREKEMLQAKVTGIRRERNMINSQIRDIISKNEFYDKRIEALTKFQYLLLEMSEARK
ncbi:hypothetical protein [Clostridium thermarum]|uniref:hypothetical protein n=1 Tax=Clostridium thermarum TaxID=1716543 RepID=UPI001123F681|nr:hypothetical protein [Clostridium thermarum]